MLAFVDFRLVESDLEHISKAEMTVEQQNATAREIHHRQQAIRKQKETRVSICVGYLCWGASTSLCMFWEGT